MKKNNKQSETPLLDQLESGPWPSFVNEMKKRVEDQYQTDVNCPNCEEIRKIDPNHCGRCIRQYAI